MCVPLEPWCSDGIPYPQHLCLFCVSQWEGVATERLILALNTMVLICVMVVLDLKCTHDWLIEACVIIACYFSLYGLELDLCSSVLALPRHQADVCPNRSALHSPKISSVWVFIELRGNEFSLFCGECSTSRHLEQTLWLAEASVDFI